MGEFGVVTLRLEQLRREQVAVARVDLRRTDPHRAIEKDAPLIKPPLLPVFCHKVEKILGATNRECGD